MKRCNVENKVFGCSRIPTRTSRQQEYITPLQMRDKKKMISLTMQGLVIKRDQLILRRCDFTLETTCSLTHEGASNLGCILMLRNSWPHKDKIAAQMVIQDH